MTDAFTELLDEMSFELFMRQAFEPIGAIHHHVELPRRRTVATPEPGDVPEPAHPFLPAVAETDPWLMCLQAFLRHAYRRSNSEGTVFTYQRRLLKFFRSCGKQDLSKINRSDIERYLDRPRKDGRPLTPSTRNSRQNTISSFFKFAASYTLPGQDDPLYPPNRPNPAAGITRERAVTTYRAMSEAEIKAFFAAIPGDTIGKRDRALFLFALFTSRREAEIVRLLWQDITHGTITEKDGKSHEGIIFRFRQKGRGAQWESQELPDICYTAILEWLKASGRLDTMQPESPIWSVIGPAQGGGLAVVGGQITTGTMRRRMQHYRQAAGLPRHFTVHSWRHSYVQMSLAQGVPITEIMRITGHKSLDAFYTYARSMQSPGNPGAALMEKRLSFLRSKSKK